MQQAIALGEGTQAEFAGFPQPTKNFFSVPNNMINIIAHITNLAELKILLYVIRHTWGYHEFGTPKAITNDEFMHGRKHADGSRMDEGTRLSEQAVRDGVRRAVEDGYLICEVDDHDKARIKKSYRLKMLGVKNLDPKNLEVNDLDPQNSRGQESVPLDPETLTSGPRNVDLRPGNSRPRSEKDTSERHSGKTREKERTLPPPTSSSSEASLSLSSNSHISSAEGEPPPSVRGGLPIAPQTDAAKNASAQASTSEGYTKSRIVAQGDSCITITQEEAPRNDAPTTQETLLQWVRDAGVGIPDNPQRIKRAVDRLLPLVKSRKDVAGLHAAAKSKYDGIVWLGNLANEEVIGIWKANHSEQERPSQRFRPGTGTIINHTYAQTWKDAPPLTYLRLPNQQSRPRATRTGNISPLDFAIQQQQFGERMGVV